MRRLAQVVGVLLLFGLGIVLVEVVFANDKSWPDVIPFVFAVLGWLAASPLVSRVHPR